MYCTVHILGTVHNFPFPSSVLNFLSFSSCFSHLCFHTSLSRGSLLPCPSFPTCPQFPYSHAPYFPSPLSPIFLIHVLTRPNPNSSTPLSHIFLLPCPKFPTPVCLSFPTLLFPVSLPPCAQSPYSPVRHFLSHLSPISHSLVSFFNFSLSTYFPFFPHPIPLFHTPLSTIFSYTLDPYFLTPLAPISSLPFPIFPNSSIHYLLSSLSFIPAVLSPIILLPCSPFPYSRARSYTPFSPISKLLCPLFPYSLVLYFPTPFSLISLTPFSPISLLPFPLFLYSLFPYFSTPFSPISLLPCPLFPYSLVPYFLPSANLISYL
jgi:hypothetical protein